MVGCTKVPIVLSALALAFGLAMDATAVCAARALGAGAARERVILPLLFGAFQAAMAALGWLGGNWAREYIAAWDHWIAGGLLLAIAIHMAYETYRHDDVVPSAGTPLLYLGLAIATSIDAAAAGLTLPLIPAAPWLVLTLIGGVTVLCSAVGYVAARALGAKLGPRLGYLGALVLAGIGIDILIRAP
jgi:putative Mn2+ efflux pump MntP